MQPLDIRMTFAYDADKDQVRASVNDRYIGRFYKTKRNNINRLVFRCSENPFGRTIRGVDADAFANIQDAASDYTVRYQLASFVLQDAMIHMPASSLVA